MSPERPAFRRAPCNRRGGFDTLILRKVLEMPAIRTAIDQMSTAEKVQTMEYLWSVLSSHYADATPAWHETVLAERADAPDSEFEDWESVKSELRHADPTR